VQTVRIEAMRQSGSQRRTRGMGRSESGSRRRVAMRVECGGLRLVGVAGLEERIVYILSKGRSRHMADVAGRHSQPARVVGKITIIDEAVVPSHAADDGARRALRGGSKRDKTGEKEEEVLREGSKRDVTAARAGATRSARTAGECDVIPASSLLTCTTVHATPALSLSVSSTCIKYVYLHAHVVYIITVHESIVAHSPSM
jgi:hypothetical protein